MSHASPIQSPPGTPLAERTVGEIVASNPMLSKVFQKHKIDFCCQGNQSLSEAAAHKNASLEDLVKEIEAVQGDAAPQQAWNPAALPPATLASYIVDTHHQYLKDELPRITFLADKVAQVHGGHTPSLVEVAKVYHKMAAELVEHMVSEEQEIFPKITSLVRGDSSDESLAESITKLITEHEHTGSDLEQLNELTNGYVAPPEACNTYRALFASLEELEANIHTHVHLENSVLFPTVLEITQKAG